jgi:hypothetical protein
MEKEYVNPTEVSDIIRKQRRKHLLNYMSSVYRIPKQQARSNLEHISNWSSLQIETRGVTNTLEIVDNIFI